MDIWPGSPYPLGAAYDGLGTNFSVFSEVADGVELCLFEGSEHAGWTEKRFELTEVDAFCWHGYLPNVGPGASYGFRGHGPWAPGEGHRCNPSKLLLDPYAKAIVGQVKWDQAVYGYPFGEPDRMETTDSAPFVPRSVVVNPYFDWGTDRPPRTPLADTIVYEVHVKGFTHDHPDVPPELRGTYAGLASPAAIEWLQRLGITAVELLPVHHFLHDDRLVKMGLRNYWGYNSIGYLAPHADYAVSAETATQLQEFKAMVKALHEADIEVILDVVYNHTAEGNHLGPTLSFKGLDNASYYRLEEDARYYRDYTGTGNSLNMRSPHVLQLIMDSLRYWVLECHVDGFRFDLAATLARELHDVDRLSAFFDLIQQDPVISQVKLIAEPWDVGEGGYQVGNFPPLWSEWNGKYRDCVRDYWRGTDRTLGELAFRLTGSSDLYESTGRRPSASVNFVTCHDGFTLADLVSYNSKHNDANGEGNADGTDDNRSWNCGVEGPTDDSEVVDLRRKQQRNFLATLMLSQGIPMLLGGDEIGRSQRGNNNGYCQDNDISWFDWDAVDKEMLEFTCRLVAFRREHAVLRRRRFFQGQKLHGSAVSDIGWFRPDGSQMTDEDWTKGYAKSIGMLLNGEAIPSPGGRGERIVDDTFLVLLNAHYEPVKFLLPGSPWAKKWLPMMDTAAEPAFSDRAACRSRSGLALAPRSLQLLRRV